MVPENLKRCDSTARAQSVRGLAQRSVGVRHGFPSGVSDLKDLLSKL